MKQFLVYVVTPAAAELEQLAPQAVYTLHVLDTLSNVKVKQSGRSKQLRKHSPIWFAVNVLLCGTMSSTLNPTDSLNVNRRHSKNEQISLLFKNDYVNYRGYDNIIKH